MTTHSDVQEDTQSAEACQESDLQELARAAAKALSEFAQALECQYYNHMNLHARREDVKAMWPLQRGLGQYRTANDMMEIAEIIHRGL